ncbi:hypothetical protein ACOMHN_016200 [Nucella lapillus]
MDDRVTVLPPDFLGAGNISWTALSDSYLTKGGHEYSPIIDPMVFHVDYYLAVVTISSLASLGIVGNIFAIVAWHYRKTEGGKKFNATEFLFKLLAVGDIAYLGLAMGYNIIIRYKHSNSNLALKLTFYHGANIVQMVAIHLTLLVAASRWIVVTFPFFRESRLLRPRMVYRFSAMTVVYCATLEAAQGIYNQYYPNSVSVSVLKQVLGLAVPLLRLLVFNISLVCTTKRRPQTLPGSGNRTELRVHSRIRMSDDCQVVTAVGLVSACSFVAYLVATGVKMRSLTNYFTMTDVVLNQIANICQVINSSINVLIFWFLMRTFRRRAKALCGRLCCGGVCLW